MFLKYKIQSIVFTIIMTLLLILCCSCSSNGNIKPSSQAYAYLEVFKKMTSDITEGETKYIGVNIKNVLFTQPTEIKKLIEDYAKEYDVSIIWNDNKDEYNSFQKGYLIIFDDLELNETKLLTQATWMGAPALAASSRNYTVEKKNDEWIITNKERTYMS